MARMIDGDAVLGRYYAEYEQQDICDGAEDRDWLMKCLTEAPAITQSTGPLTLEELSLCNDPVWIKRIGDEDLSGDGWAIVEGPRCLTWHNRIPVSWEILVWWPGSEVEDCPKYENYNKTWIAYRRPPEGEA